MNDTTNVFNDGTLGRLSRRVVLGGAVLAAAAAVVVLGDNGVPTGMQSPELQGLADDSAMFCQPYVIGFGETPELPGLGLMEGEVLGAAKGGTNVPPIIDTNAPPLIDTNVPPKVQTNAPAVGGTNAPAMKGAECAVNGSCLNRDISVHFTFSWCCKPGKSCYVKVGGVWLSLARLLQFNAGGCIVKVGCY